MDEKYTELAVKLQEIDSRCRSSEHRIESLEEGMKCVQDTQISLVKIANSVENMSKSMIDVNEKVDLISDKQDKLNDKVTVMENRPAQETKKMLDGIYEKILWVIIGGMAVAALSSLFPSIPW